MQSKSSVDSEQLCKVLVFRRLRAVVQSKCPVDSEELCKVIVFRRLRTVVQSNSVLLVFACF